MTRRTFIKGVVAVGLMALVPLKARAGFHPRPYQMAYAQEFMRGMSRTVSSKLMYGRGHAPSMDVFTGLASILDTPNKAWFTLKG